MVWNALNPCSYSPDNWANLFRNGIHNSNFTDFVVYLGMGSRDTPVTEVSEGNWPL